MSWGRPPALAVAKEDGGGPGLLALLIAPRGFDEAFMLGMIGDSDIARYEGGRGACKAAGWLAKSSMLVEEAEFDVSGVGDASGITVGSGETKPSIGEPMLG